MLAYVCDERNEHNMRLIASALVGILTYTLIAIMVILDAIAFALSWGLLGLLAAVWLVHTLGIWLAIIPGAIIAWAIIGNILDRIGERLIARGVRL
ncbi:hypothetical protein [Thermoleophilum album]|uniref:Uncharacterized protein n=1 Tax=Thermoleophilum album TaxID=29539 RepID=A0A1H6FUI9_THEAL|nr:hypothetical protein [Thermoleophilum album]SEH13653.1 hypothetical protein SAMN02745716_1242 [Thermoleophilum album]